MRDGNHLAIGVMQMGCKSVIGDVILAGLHGRSHCKVQDNASPALPQHHSILCRQHNTASVQPQSNAGKAALSLTYPEHGSHRGRCPHTNGVPHRDLVAAHVMQPLGHMCCCSRLHLALQTRPPLKQQHGSLQGVYQHGEQRSAVHDQHPLQALCAFDWKSSSQPATHRAL